jgi:hypothetical protein
MTQLSGILGAFNPKIILFIAQLWCALIISVKFLLGCFGFWPFTALILLMVREYYFAKMPEFFGRRPQKPGKKALLRFGRRLWSLGLGSSISPGGKPDMLAALTSKGLRMYCLEADRWVGDFGRFLSTDQTKRNQKKKWD